MPIDLNTASRCLTSSPSPELGNRTLREFKELSSRRRYRADPARDREVRQQGRGRAAGALRHEREEVAPSTCPLRISSIRNRSVSSARTWIDAFRLSIICELNDGCGMTSCTAASAAACVPIEHRRNARYRSAGSSRSRSTTAPVRIRQTCERSFRTAKEHAKLARRLASCLVDHTLRRIGEHELVALLNRVAASLQIESEIHDSTANSQLPIPKVTKSGDSLGIGSRALALLACHPPLWVVMLEILPPRDPAEDHRLGDPPLLRPHREVDVRDHETDERHASQPMRTYVNAPRAVARRDTDCA